MMIIQISSVKDYEKKVTCNTILVPNLILVQPISIWYILHPNI